MQSEKACCRLNRLGGGDVSVGACKTAEPLRKDTENRKVPLGTDQASSVTSG